MKEKETKGERQEMDRIKRLMDLDHCFFFELPDRIESRSRKRNFKLTVLIG